MSSDKQIHLCKIWKVKMRKRPSLWHSLLFLPASSHKHIEYFCGTTPGCCSSYVGKAQSIGHQYFCWCRSRSHSMALLEMWLCGFLIPDCKESMCPWTQFQGCFSASLPSCCGWQANSAVLLTIKVIPWGPAKCLLFQQLINKHIIVYTKSLSV